MQHPIKEVTNEDLLAIRKLLSDHIPKWAQVMADRLNSNPEYSRGSWKPCTEGTAYNIAAGFIAQQYRRRAFMKEANDLLSEIFKQE